ncbi:RsmD family RNA methyltransferase [bacterium]|nr:RsmD family RNA methyltransferase [bacterium]
MTRIVAGEWKGHSLPRLKAGSARPTTDRARTILFDTLHNVQEMHVLDLYSGTGALGFEALSRGAKSLVSIDHDREYILQQKAWIKQHQKPFQAFVGDVKKVLGTLKEKFDLILADPPYDNELPPEVLNLIKEHAAFNSIFVYERHRQNNSKLDSMKFILEKEKVVSETRIQFYKVTSHE